MAATLPPRVESGHERPPGCRYPPLDRLELANNAVIMMLILLFLGATVLGDGLAGI